MAPKQVPAIHLGVTSLDSEFQLSRSLNNSDTDKSFSSNFFKYSVMLGLSIWFYRHLNTNIRPLVIILWQNILKQQCVAWKSLLTTLTKRNFYREVHRGHISYCSRIRKNVIENRHIENRHTENRHTENRHTENRRRIQLQRPLYHRTDVTLG